jgi:hypothetical protein
MQNSWRRAMVWIGQRWPLVIVLVAAAWFLGLVWYPETRWGAVTELWSALVVAIPLWYLLERRSGRVQRNVWLEEHAIHVRPIVQSVRASAAVILGQVLRGGMHLNDGLNRYAPTEKRMAALAEIAAAVECLRDGNAETVRAMVDAALPSADAINLHRVLLKKKLDGTGGDTLAPLTEIQGLSHQFIERVGAFTRFSGFLSEMKRANFERWSDFSVKHGTYSVGIDRIGCGTGAGLLAHSQRVRFPFQGQALLKRLTLRAKLRPALPSSRRRYCHQRFSNRRCLSERVREKFSRGSRSTSRVAKRPRVLVAWKKRPARRSTICGVGSSSLCRIH